MPATHLIDYTLPPLRPEIPKDHYERYVLPDPTSGKSKSWTRATTVAKSVKGDTSGLERWTQRNILTGLAMRPDLMQSVDLNADPDTLKARLHEIIDIADGISGSNIKRERGTQLHYFTEAVDTGFCGIDAVPAEYQREVAAFTAAIADAGIEYDADAVERTLYVPLAKDLKIVGTADRWRVKMPDGRFVVLDVKSGTIRPLELAMQLAIYARAELMWNDGAWVPTESVDQRVGILAHVPVDSGVCTLHQVDLVKGWNAVQTAIEAYRIHKAAFTKTLVVEYSREAWMKTAAPVSDPFVELPVDPEDPSVVAIPDGPVDIVVDTTEMSAIDVARAAFDRVKAEAANALEDRKAAGHKRRTKAMIRADEQAGLVDDGVPSVEVFDAARKALIDAYELHATAGDDSADHTDHVHIAPEQLTTDDAPKTAERMCVPCGGWFPESQFQIEGDVVGHRVGPVVHDANVRRGVDTDEPDDVDATIRDALDHCSTADDMMVVYNDFAGVWSPALTEYGNAVLASKENAR